MGMDLEHERLALQHLENALTWPPDERDQRLLEALAHDPALLTDVRELLRAALSVNDALPTALPFSTPGADAPPPEQLGPYRVKELLGQGGMGRVYRAERADGAFERTVAIKLMRKTRVPELIAAQFARERRILAGLQHRNIAQLLDGGVTRGRPFLFRDGAGHRARDHAVRHGAEPFAARDAAALSCRCARPCSSRMRGSSCTRTSSRTTSS